MKLRPTENGPARSVRVLVPELVWHDGKFRSDWCVAIDLDTGCISWTGPLSWLAANGGRDAEIVRLTGRLLVPGFVNVHSHAFQRLIRGRTQWRRGSAPNADFWSWREAMYLAALTLTPEQVYDVSRFSFIEMLRAGWTTVGEFHYMQRDPDGRRYATPNELAERVIAAAEDVGIRIVLLNVCYATGGIDIPLSERQRRFRTDDADTFLADTEALASFAADRPYVSTGVAPHSVRAVPRAWLSLLGDWARERDLPLHMHVSEQPAEVAASVAAYGLRPVEVLSDADMLDSAFTAVHATHLTANEIALLGGAGATIGACPTTERDLGDGLLCASELHAAGASIALGTDSQTVIDPFVEMSLVEYHERLRGIRRILLTAPEGDDRLGVAPQLIAQATRNGARSLGLDAGRIAPGALADLVAIDLTHRSLIGWDGGNLGALLTLCASAEVVSDVWVGGIQRISARQHAHEERAAASFERLSAGMQVLQAGGV